MSGYDNFRYARINSATTTGLGTFPRVLGRINILAMGAGATFEVFDSNDGSGTSLGKFTSAAAQASPISLHYDVETSVGLSITTTGTVDLLISYR